MTRHINVDQTGTELFTTANPGKVLQTGSNVTDGQTLWTPGMLYNEVTSDKPRGNTQGTLLASAARTATIVTPIQTNYNAKGIQIIVDVATASGTGGLQIVVRGSSASGKKYNLNATPTAITTAGTHVIEVYPGVSGTTGQIDQSSQHLVPRNFDVMIIHVDATSYTYSAEYALIL